MSRNSLNTSLSSIRGRSEPNPAAAGIHIHTDHVYPVHLHSRFYVFAHITEGNCVCFGKKTSHPLPSYIAHTGDLVIVPPGTPHSGYPCNGDTYSCRTMYINKEYVDSLIEDENGMGEPAFSHSILPGRNLLERFSMCIDRIIPEYASLTSGDVFHQHDYFLPEFEEQLIWFIEDLVNTGMAAIPSSGNGRIHEEEQRSIQKIKDYILNNLTRKISLDILARKCGKSKFHLVRTFKAEAGLPPLQYQHLERINRAKAMLKSGIALADIAIELGFYDQSHFQNRFKCFTGLTPGQYLKGQDK